MSFSFFVCEIIKSKAKTLEKKKCKNKKQSLFSVRLFPGWIKEVHQSAITLKPPKCFFGNVEDQHSGWVFYSMSHPPWPVYVNVQCIDRWSIHTCLPKKVSGAQIKRNRNKRWSLFSSYRWYSGRDVWFQAVEHLHSMRTVLWAKTGHDQTSDHDKQANKYQDGRYQVFALKPATRGEFEEACRWYDEDQRGGTQNALDGRRAEASK